MITSESITKIAPALLAVQKEIENPHKNSENPHFRNRYADLAEIINTMREVCANHGIVVVQSTGMSDGNCTVDTMLLHESGEWIRSNAACPLPKQDPQGVGSATTYLRRYSLAAMLCLAQEDDDGNVGSKKSPPQTQRATPQDAANVDPRHLAMSKVMDWSGVNPTSKDVFKDAVGYCIEQATGQKPTGKVDDATWTATTKWVQAQIDDDVDFADVFRAE